MTNDYVISRTLSKQYVRKCRAYALFPHLVSVRAVQKLLKSIAIIVQYVFYVLCTVAEV